VSEPPISSHMGGCVAINGPVTHASEETRQLFLVSLSPSRRQQLARAGFRFEQVAPGYEDPATPEQSDAPAFEARALAAHKALSRYELAVAGHVVLSGDTIVITGSGHQLGKPTGVDHARRMLQELIDRPHSVVSGICVLTRDEMRLGHVEAPIRITPPNLRAVDEFISTGLWRDVAGGYRTEDVRNQGWQVETSVEPVGGLPIDLVADRLAAVGVFPDDR
jgi:septum formation protein